MHVRLYVSSYLSVKLGMTEAHGQLFEVIPSKVKGHPEVNLPKQCPMVTLSRVPFIGRVHMGHSPAELPPILYKGGNKDCMQFF